MEPSTHPHKKAAMNDAEFVLCKWKKRLWPAKVLSQGCAATKQRACKDATNYLCVEILGLNEQARVRCEDVESLTEERIGHIAAQLGQSKKCCDVMGEITHRRVLREALANFRQAAPCKERSPSKMGRSKAAVHKETKERSLPRVAGRGLPSSQNSTQRRRGRTCEASTAPPTAVGQNKPSRCSREKAEGSPSARSPMSKSRVLSGNGELDSQPHQATQTKIPSRPKKDLMLKSLSSPSRRSLRFSKGDERHHQCKSGWESSSPSSPPKSFATTSTPTQSSRTCAKLTPGKKGTKEPGPRRKLLSLPIKCPSAEAAEVLSEKEELPPRKYSKDLAGQRHPQELKGTCQEQTPVVFSLCPERRHASHEGSPSIPDPFGPILDGIQEEGPCLCVDQAENIQLCDSEGKAGLVSPSDPALRCSPISKSQLSSAFGDEEGEDEEELPSILLHQEPCSMEVGMLVWCKLRRYPYWPAVVKSMKRKVRKAIVQIVQKSMNDKKCKGSSFCLRRLKHFDCEEKQVLIDKAREGYRDEINWCINLIADYRIRVGCHSFTGTFLEYFADDISYPVRKEVHLDLYQMTFPQISEAEAEEPVSEATPTKPAKKVLPDRTRAARDKANEKIVEFIVNGKADGHLQAVLKSKEQSRWLKEFLNAPKYLTCIETYLEDEIQQERVVEYLKKVYREVDAKLLPFKNGDNIEFILDVLFPEAIIYAISAVDRIDYKKAEDKYRRGPLLSQREREIFEEEILEKKRKQLLQQASSSPEEAS